jgi:hypothetical protein
MRRESKDAERARKQKRLAKLEKKKFAKLEKLAKVINENTGDKVIIKLREPSEFSYYLIDAHRSS